MHSGWKRVKDKACSYMDGKVEAVKMELNGELKTVNEELDIVKEELREAVNYILPGVGTYGQGGVRELLWARKELLAGNLAPPAQDDAFVPLPHLIYLLFSLPLDSSWQCKERLLFTSRVRLPAITFSGPLPSTTLLDPTHLPRPSFPSPPSAHHSAKGNQFDGKVAWEAYHIQFEILANDQLWSVEERTLQLIANLRGDNMEVLGQLTPAQRASYVCVVAALQRRFGHHQQAEVYWERLKGRVKARGEPFSQLALEVNTLVHRAY